MTVNPQNTGDVVIRPMLPSDIDDFPEGFAEQGWNKPRTQFETYYSEQGSGARWIFVAETEGRPVGYITMMSFPDSGPFMGRDWPELRDFNVLIPYRGRGIGTRLIETAENAAAQVSDTVCLGVGLHSGYGTAQRMYVKRGYIPDGSGVWWQDKPLAEMAACCNDDDLILYFSKRLKIASETG